VREPAQHLVPARRRESRALRTAWAALRLTAPAEGPREVEEFIVLSDESRRALATVTGDVYMATSQGLPTFGHETARGAG
jgi:hypothetical protein